jgi:uncharacterized protein (DUF1800 family)
MRILAQKRWPRRKASSLTKPKPKTQQKVQAARQAIAANVSGRAQLALSRIQGPQRIVVGLSMAKLDRAVYSNRQLEAVMADFWFIDFNVYANKGAVRLTLTSYERDVIRPHAIGQFDDLLIETAKSPRDALLPRQLALR